MELNNLDMIEKDVIDYNYTSNTSKTLHIPDISSLNKEEFDNYKDLLYKKYNILTKIYKIPKLDINEPFIVTHNKYYRYINLLNDK